MPGNSMQAEGLMNLTSLREEYDEPGSTHDHPLCQSAGGR